MSGFTISDIPSQIGKRVIVTGANSGLGYETVLALANTGADVILAARSEKKGSEALAKIRALSPQAKVRLEHKSVRDREHDQEQRELDQHRVIDVDQRMLRQERG